MAKRTSIRPSYTHTVGLLLDFKIPVRAMCDTCPGFRDVDLVALAAIMGADYDLWGRRTRCRITEGCNGINRFYFYGRGRYETMQGPARPVLVPSCKSSAGKLGPNLG